MTLAPAAVQGTPTMPSGAGRKRELYASWLAQQGELESLKGRVVFTVGTHKGKTYTKQDLAEMVRAFDPTLNQIRPRVKVGHDDAQSYARLRYARLGTASDETSLGHPALGWIDNPRLNDEYVDRNGKRHEAGTELLVDFVNLDPDLARDLRMLRYLDRSSEVIRNYQDKERPGVVWPCVLQNVAFLGDELPAVRDMAPLVELNAEQAAGLEVVTFRFTEGDEPMAAEMPPGVPGKTPATLDDVLAGLNKLGAMFEQMMALQKKDVDQQPPPAEDNTQRPGVDMAQKPAVPAAPAVPAQQGDPAAEKHSENPALLKLQADLEAQKRQATESAQRFAELQRQVLADRAAALAEKDKAEAERFAEGLSSPSNFRIPVDLRADVARLYQNAPDVQRFSDGAGGEKTFRQQLADVLGKLPPLVSPSAFHDHAKRLTVNADDPKQKLERFADDKAKELAKAEGIPYAQALYRVAQSDDVAPQQFAQLLGIGTQAAQGPQF